MTEGPESKKEIEALQQNPDYIIMNNPLASPKFVRAVSKSEQRTITEIYTPKVFYEIVSQLKPEHLIGVANNQNITIEIVIKDFLREIGAEKTKNYQHLITSVETLQTTILKWRDEKGEHRSPIVAFSTHDRHSSIIQVQVHEKLVKLILDVKEKGNFGFFKKNVHRLQNAQAVKLYPFFKAWMNYGRYETTLVRFKEHFGYNTSGYDRFAALEKYVLMPALDEINDKTDIRLSYQKVGENLDGRKPRVTGLIFYIKPKDKTKTTALLEGPPEPGLQLTTEFEEQPVGAEPPANTPLTQEEFGQLFELFKDIWIEERPEAITGKLLIDGYVTTFGKETVYDAFTALIDTKAKAKSVAFFTPEVFERYKGYRNRKETKRQTERTRLNQKQQQQAEAERMQLIIADFERREQAYFMQAYEKIGDDERTPIIDKLRATHTDNPAFFGAEGLPTELGKREVASYYVVNHTPYNRRLTFQKIAEREFNVQIDFDEAGTPFFVK
jgi:hypothetical protein